jgi:beta-xylosidase
MDFWAPEIHQLGEDYFVVYFVARDTTGMLCVGAATSESVTGPFKDIGAPLIRNDSVGYIDPTFFRVDSQNYIFWKEDGNGRNPPEKYTPIWATAISDDGLTLLGEKVEVLRNDPNSWESFLVEAPWVISYQGYFYLFYSGNGYASTEV